MKYTREELMDMYGDWVNNFLTRGYFAEYYEISLEQAEEIIMVGRELWDERAMDMEMCTYFGHIYENVCHMKNFMDRLRESYNKEVIPS